MVRFIGIILLFIFTILSKALSQKEFSLIYFPEKAGRLEILYEQGSFYIAFGYRTAISLDMQSLHIDKKTGKVLRSSYYEMLDRWLPNNGRLPIYTVGDQLYLSQREITDVTYILYSVTGASMDKLSLSTPHHRAVWDVSHLADRRYILTIYKDGNVLGSQQIVKQ